jgi:outer membrane lipoprotein carrier protein
MTGRYARGPTVATALLLALTLGACGGAPDGSGAEDRPASEFPGMGDQGGLVGGDTAWSERPVDPGMPVLDVDGTTGPAVTDGSTAGTGAGSPPAAGGAPAAPGEPGSARPGDDAQGRVPAGVAQQGTDAILRATAQRYEQVRSLQAEFVQELRNPLLGQTTRSRGMLYQRQPDRFLMRFSDPDGDIIVSDGEFFWVYYPSVDARQVMRSPRGPQGLDLHAQFIGDPVSRFQATAHGQEAVGGRMAHVMTLVPRQPLGYRSLKVWIDAADHLVRRFELTEDNGTVRHFELGAVTINPTLPDRLFQFTPPEGAQVIQR